MSNDEADGPDPYGQIETLRLVLRPPGKRDHTAMAALAEHARVMENLAALPEADAVFAIVEKNSAEVIGAAIYGSLPERPFLTEIACWIGDKHRGVGYATEAAHAVIDRAFANPALAVLWCSSRVMNAEARRVIEKCGFQFRETGMARSPASRGAVPVERFALDRRNWRALRTWGSSGERNDRDGETQHVAA